MNTSWLIVVAVLGTAALLSLQLYFLYSLRIRRMATDIQLSRFRYEGERREPPAFRQDRSDELLRQILVRQTELFERMGTPTVVVNNAAPSSRSRDNVEASGRGQNLNEIIREISHSLNTPLSQIEIAALRLHSEEGVTGDPGMKELADRIANSVEVSKAFLLAFRELAHVASSVGDWQPESLQKSAAAAANLYLDAEGEKELNVIVELPEVIEGYTNSFVLATLLPLIENAVEAAPADSKLVVKYINEGSQVIVVENSASSEPKQDQIFNDGYSSKGGRHQGLGLTVVRRLLSSRRGAGVDYQWLDGRVRFTVRLPGVTSAAATE